MDKVASRGGETLACHRTTMEFLTMSDQEQDRSLKLGETKGYSTDLDYRPSEFKNETRRIMTDAAYIKCSGCSGVGRVTCGSCSGDGWVSCSTTMSCSRCNGSGKLRDDCGACGGSGRVPKMVQGRYGAFQDGTTSCSSCGGRGGHERSCGSCSGGRATCSKCSGRGRVNCGRCGTSGEVRCDRCDGVGELVSARIITRKFAASTQFTFQLSGLAADQFKNGLAAKHFNSMTGDLASQQFEPPGSAETVLQRRSLHSYDVLSGRYAYNDREFYLNRITAGGRTKYVTAGLPLSWKKIAISVAVVCASVLAVGALVVML